jgi:hypothetical protein
LLLHSSDLLLGFPTGTFNTAPLGASGVDVLNAARLPRGDEDDDEMRTTMSKKVVVAVRIACRCGA